MGAAKYSIQMDLKSPSFVSISENPVCISDFCSVCKSHFFSGALTSQWTPEREHTVQRYLTI